MEKQLAFKEIEEVANRQTILKTKHAKSTARYRKSIKSSSQAQNPWWKLSPEERAIGIRGIAQIREILDKYPQDDRISFKKAS